MPAEANARKTEQELHQEIAGLFREIGTRTYTRHLIDGELAQLNAKLYELNAELYARQQARAAIQAEQAAAETSTMDAAEKAVEAES